MKGAILAYNFNGERMAALKMVAALVKCLVKPVEPQSFDKAIGYLVGLKDVPELGLRPGEGQGVEVELENGEKATQEQIELDLGFDEAGKAAVLQQELLVLCGFDQTMLDKLLTGIRKGKLQRVEHKAMLTTTNCTWSGAKLMQEIAVEHAYMKKYGRPKD